MTTPPLPQADPLPLRSLAVIGAGQRGRTFALRCLQAGYEVVLEDVLSSNLRKAEEQMAAGPAAWRERLRLASSVEDAVRTADLAIDFVPDELESKLEIFSLVDRMAPPRTVICTPTALSIADLASCTYRAERCIAVSPFGDEMETSLTLTLGPATLPVVATAVQRWLQSLRFGVTRRQDSHAGQGSA